MSVDLEADLNMQDHTGYCWSFLDEARDPAIIEPGAIILAGGGDANGEAVAVARVMELEEIDTGTIVRFQILPGHIEDYAVLVKRHQLTA